MYEGRLLAPWIDGAVLNADAGRNLVYAHFPRPRGAGFEMERTVLIQPKASSTRLRFFWRTAYRDPFLARLPRVDIAGHLNAQIEPR